MVTRSTLAKEAKSTFFEHINDIDVFVEDKAEGSEKFYTKLLSKTLHNKYSISKIFPLGPKLNVIKASKSPSPSRKEIYIIDGDLDLIRDDSYPRQDCLVRLERYCIENFLIQESATSKLIDKYDIVKSEAEIIQDLNFSDWIQSNKVLTDLFIVYAVAQPIISDPLSSFHVERLSPNKEGRVDEHAVKTRIKELEVKVSEIIGEEELKLRKDKIAESIKERDLHVLHCASGKTYLLPLLRRRMRSLASKLNVDDALLKNLLVDLVDTNELEEKIKESCSWYLEDTA